MELILRACWAPPRPNRCRPDRVQTTAAWRWSSDSWFLSDRSRAKGAERVERQLAFVLPQEAQEALVVAARHVEELDQHAVVAARALEPAAITARSRSRDRSRSMNGTWTADQNDSPPSIMRCNRRSAVGSAQRPVLRLRGWKARTLVEPRRRPADGPTREGSALLGEVAWPDRLARRFHGEPFDDVLQLAHVAWPAVGHQHRSASAVSVRGARPVLLGEQRGEEREQLRDVVPALAQRRRRGCG